MRARSCEARARFNRAAADRVADFQCGHKARRELLERGQVRSELLGHGLESMVTTRADAAVGVAQARGLNDKWRRALSRDFGERPLPFLDIEDESGYLGDKDDANCLEKVDAVWASPLTGPADGAYWIPRLPATEKLALHASCREVKNVGGFDSVGLETGSFSSSSGARRSSPRPWVTKRRPHTYVTDWLATPGTPRASGGCRPKDGKVKEH